LTYEILDEYTPNCQVFIQTGMVIMAIGTVKWFNNQKGYGFINYDGKDVFAHYSVVDMDGYKSLKAGQQVQFEVTQGPKGLHATDIQPVEEEIELTM